MEYFQKTLNKHHTCAMIEIIYRECYVFFVCHNEIDFVSRNDIKRHKATFGV